MKNNASLERQIEQLKFNESSSMLLMRIIRSCPQEDNSIIPILIDFFKTNPVLAKLCDFLPSAHNTIRDYFLMTAGIDEYKETISQKDILMAFASNSHHNAMVKVSHILGRRNLPQIFTNPKMTKTEFLYSHIVKNMRIKEENGILVGYDDYGTKAIGLYFFGNKRNLKKIIKEEQYAAVHFAAVISEVDNTVKKEICNIQKQNRLVWNLVSDMKKTIDYTIKYNDVCSTLECTQKRFKI